MTRVLIVDRSSVVRQTMSALLEDEPDIHVVGMASDAYVARDQILSRRPDVVLLDLELPRMDGVTFVRKIMRHHPLPVIVISSISPKAGRLAMQAMQAGAVEVLCKPTSALSLRKLGPEVIAAVRRAARSRVRTRAPWPISLHPTRPDARTPNGHRAPHPTRPSTNASLWTSPKPSSPPSPVAPVAPVAKDASGEAADGRKLIAIGASTGGTETTRQILQAFPATAPGTLIVQHISADFAAAYAGYLDDTCKMKVRIAQDGDLVKPGVALVAPGDEHITVSSVGKDYLVRTNRGPQVHYQRPSVDVLFKSVAKVCGPEAVGLLLTGMGKDGAEGLAAMLAAGARTIVQDEKSSIVYGMPKAAVELGAAEQVLPLNEIATATMRACA